MRSLTLEPDVMTRWLSTMPIPAPAIVEPETAPVELWRYGIHDLDDAKAALTEAERVIRHQEERIRQLEDMALTDELTGLLNRRGFQLMLKREIVAAQRDPSAHGALVMIDLDGFKQVNDTYGHAVGDAYLKFCGEQLVRLVRGHDCVARLGGDEFAIVLARISPENVISRLPQIEKDFHAIDFNWLGEMISLKASFGVSTYTSDSQVGDLMAEADLRLYAKKGSRRR